ncbi:MAG: VapC toxin family PIN domain ribonuclease [Rhizomicrobium sp.]
MAGYLVDTNVISAAPARAVRTDLVAGMDAQSALLSLSAMSVAKIEDGIAKLQREGATRRSEDLAAWLEALRHLHGGRILALDTATADRRCAVGSRPRRRPGAWTGRHHYRAHGTAAWPDRADA